jgi:hypothetical protein
MGAAITSWQSGAPTFAAANSGAVWKTPLSFACLGFMSSSMGLQGVMAKRLNTQFSTTGIPFLSRPVYIDSPAPSGIDIDMGRAHL